MDPTSCPLTVSLFLISKSYKVPWGLFCMPPSPNFYKTDIVNIQT